MEYHQIILKKHNIMVDIEGRIFRYFPKESYKIELLRCVSILIIGILGYIVKEIPYHHITIIGKTIYSKISASCLSRQKIPYVFCRSNNRLTYYETENRALIPFEGVSFHTDLDHEIPLICKSEDELKRLQDHTKLDNLPVIQNIIIDSLINKGDVPILTNEDLTLNIPIKAPVLDIKRFCNNLYYVTTINESWITKLVITDIVNPLRPSDVISALTATFTSEFIGNYEIHNDIDECIVSEPQLKTILKRDSNYIVDDILRIHSADLLLSCNSYEGPMYNLTIPRPFTCNGLHVIHPFHFPKTWDPLLDVMIITLGLVL